MTAAAGLTDGTGVSRLTGSKVLKDLVADFLLTGAAALVSVQVMDLGGAIAAPQVAGLAVAGALIRTLYRAVLRWATS
jgi:hypothetical protein